MDDLGAKSLSSKIDKLAARTGRLERMVVTVGTVRDTPQFRENLYEEKTEGMETVHDIIKVIRRLGKNHPDVKPLTRRFEKEARKFQDAVAKIRDAEARTVEKFKSEGSSIGEEDDLKVGLLSAGQLQVESKMTQLEHKRNQIRNLEQDVTELASMFRDMQGLVDDQQQTVDQIVVHVESAVEATDNAASELQKAERYQRAARRRQLCCCILLLIIVAIIAIVIWVLVKK
eukprot:CAMPEP_0167757368 /NCGR_PEP_ID=MMETSP0110_2-20121227/9885_1 /TAXON_ID=629695 /ORGANISM="Gymnochlora sp., Strain CCMP2014" /LENGTH=229 /DNA_ID=CAMNT_0007643547 /DNA_START=23 /DNA_END=712 /DNA_ORIENTATION=+